MKYFDGIKFYDTQDELQTRYQITDEEQVRLFEEANLRSDEDNIFQRIGFLPDSSGRPIVGIIKRDLEETKSIIRRLRNNRVFPIINRSNLWYNSLTQEQKDELQIWYKNWLDATDTLIIPERPVWLN